jgi:hypothetical protein
LNHQIELGFNPKWFITFHYKHPSERYKHRKETNNPLGFKDRYGMDTASTLWKEIPKYKFYERKRKDIDAVEADCYEIRNVIAKELYGISRINHLDKFPPMFFFHELGIGAQYHTHLLMPECNYENLQVLEFIWNHKLKKKRKCFSKYKIHIREIDNPKIALDYVNKETSAKHNSLDYSNSHFILPNL